MSESSAILDKGQLWRVETGDCLSVLPSLPDACADAIITDPPYFRVKSEAWDRQWDNPAAFLEWLGTVLAQFRRVLKPNGSLYLFASPQMAARVEMKVGESFNIINRVTWRKPPFATKAEMFDKDTMRGFFPASESIIFAEQQGSDSVALAEAGYARECGELHKNVYAPLGRYIQQERERAGLTRNDVEVGLGFLSSSDPTRGTALCYRWEEGSSLPTKETYHRLRELLNTRGGGDYLRREYEDLRREYEDLRREYEDLRREYEDLRRPFNVTPSVPYTDVWDFDTVSAYPGKHPCEKPVPLLTHMITASTLPGALVLDAFMGTGSCGVACLKNGRRFLGIEKNPDYVKTAAGRLRAIESQPGLFDTETQAPAEKRPRPKVIPLDFGTATTDPAPEATTP